MSYTSKTVLVSSGALHHFQASKLRYSASGTGVNFLVADFIPQIPHQFYQISSVQNIEKHIYDKVHTNLEIIATILGVTKEACVVLTRHETSLQTLAKQVDAQCIIDDKPTHFFTRLGRSFSSKVFSGIPILSSEEYLRSMTPPKRKRKNRARRGLTGSLFLKHI